MNETAKVKSALTLGEAIAQLRALDNSGVTDKLSSAERTLFEQHDAVHVLFDCGTSIHDEIAVHLWMLLATTAKLNAMHRVVSHQEHRHLLSDMGHLQLIRIWVTSLPRLIGILARSLRLKKRLAVEELSQLKQQSIADIRREHGIVL